MSDVVAVLCFSHFCLSVWLMMLPPSSVGWWLMGNCSWSQLLRYSRSLRAIESPGVTLESLKLLGWLIQYTSTCAVRRLVYKGLQQGNAVDSPMVISICVIFHLIRANMTCLLSCTGHKGSLHCAGVVTPECTLEVIDPLYHSRHNDRDRQYECDRGIRKVFAWEMSSVNITAQGFYQWRAHGVLWKIWHIMTLWWDPNNSCPLTKLERRFASTTPWIKKQRHKTLVHIFARCFFRFAKLFHWYTHQ